MSRMVIILDDEIRRALLAESKRTYRLPRDEAVLLLRWALRKRGALTTRHPASADTSPISSQEVRHGGAHS